MEVLLIQLFIIIALDAIFASLLGRSSLLVQTREVHTEGHRGRIGSLGAAEARKYPYVHSVCLSFVV